MTNDTFGRDLDLWLREDAAHRVPDHLAELLVQSAGMRQRRWWSSLERWLPVDLTTRASTLAPPPLGRLIAVALIVLAIAAATLVVVGSRQPRVPPPFGPAANGVQIASGNGDIYVLDPTTQEHRPLISGPTWDFGAGWSRDGTSLSFLRAASGPVGDAPVPLTLVVATPDGSIVRDVVGPMVGLDWLDRSPDGRQFAFLTNNHAGDGVINIVDVESKAVTTLDATAPTHEFMWRPPDGREIVFRRSGPNPALFAIGADGKGVRQVSTSPARNGDDYSWPTLSPDGSQIAFARFMGDAGFDLYLLDVDTGEERLLPKLTGSQLGAPAFSPDGKTLAYPRSRDDRSFDIVVAPVDGSSTGTAVGEHLQRMAEGEMNAAMTFAPDGSALIVRHGTDDEATTWWWPLDGSPATTLDDGSYEFVDVQRVAP